MTTMRRIALSLLAVVLASTSLWARLPSAPSPAQAPASAGQAPQPAAASQEPPSSQASAPETDTRDQRLPAEPAGFAYNPEGRRDPFVSLVGRGAEARGGRIGARPTGLAGLEVAEVTLRGTLRSRDGFVAMLQGADQKTYIVRAGDNLFDGVVRSISQEDMVILQQVNDPLSLASQREVRKVLRQAEANQPGSFVP